MNERDVVVMGGGGHAKVLIDVLRRRGIAIADILDADEMKTGSTVLGIKVSGTDRMLDAYAAGHVWLVNGVGSVTRPDARAALYERLVGRGYEFLTVTHPSAVIADDVGLAAGVQIMASAVIQPGTEIGRNTIINTSASVDHDCRIGAHAHIAPGVVMCGNVVVGEGSHIGSGAIIVQGVTVGAGCMVKAGALVAANVPDGAVLHSRAIAKP